MKHQNKKVSRRLAAAMMAGAMMISMVGMTAFAATTNVGGMAHESNSISFDSTIDMENAVGAGLPKVDIIYTLTVSDAPENAVDSEKSLVADGVAGAIAVTGNSQEDIISFDSDTQDNTEAVTFEFDMTKFTKPGIYYYQVQATDPNVNGLTVNADVYIVKVYVKNASAAGTYEIADVTMYKASDSEMGKVGEIGNSYATKTLNLTKQIEGTMANMSEKFGFTITISDPNATRVTYTVNAGAESVSAFSSNNAVIRVNAPNGIGDDQSIIVTGIPAGATVQIEEAETAGYDTKIDKDFETGDTSADSDLANGRSTGNMSMDNDGMNVVYYNIKDAVSPTGIAMTVAPYIIMVAAAAGVAVLFLRRRNNEF